MTERPSHERVNILGVGVSALNMPMAIDHLIDWIEHRDRHFVIISNVHVVMEAHKDATFRKAINRAGMITPDGMPLVFLSRWMGHKHVDRVYGPDLMLAASQAMAEQGYSHFYYGGAEGVPEQLARNMAEKFPGLKIAGTYSPPFRALTPEEDDAIVDRINEANPDIVWVGLGCPKQEKWMVEHRDRLNAPALIGVGAAFNFHTGTVPQAPLWMQRSALEWVYRLKAEPRRLWKRYLIYNPLFMLYVGLQFLGIRRVPVETA